MDHPQPKRRIAKPLGLYIIAVFDFIAVGLIPFLTIFFAVRNTESELPMWVVMISLALPAFVMAAAVWAWVGDSAARPVLLVLVTLMSILLIINNIVLVSSGEIPREHAIRPTGVIIRASFWIAINWWYFNRRHVVEFFRQNR